MALVVRPTVKVLGGDYTRGIGDAWWWRCGRLGRRRQPKPVSNHLSGSVVGHVVQAGSIGEIHLHHPAEGPPVVPAQLPIARRLFTGRDRELRILRRWHKERTGQPLLVVLTGQAGVGKTSLGLRWLHEICTEYPDGQLFANLCGAAQSAPVAPSEMLEWFLVSLGVKAKNIPTEKAQREALFRSVTSSRRLAVLLDDAASAAQVRSLIPSGMHSVAVVTSRFRLSGLVPDGAQWLEVGLLDQSGSLLVLEEMVGAERMSTEVEAAHELAKLCGGLPLALSVVGARLSTRPRRRLEHEATELRSAQRRLSGLSLDGVSVEATLDTSYEGLGPEAKLLYRVCSAHPGREFGVEVAAAAVDWTIDQAESVLDSLAAANLLIERDDSRFTYHDLLLLHAQRRTEKTDPSEYQATVLRRMIEWYLNQSVAADQVIHPLRPRLGPRYAISSPADGPFASEQEALAWLEAERSNIRSALETAWQRGWHELVWQICESLWGFFLHTRHYDDWLELHRRGIDSAIQCGNPRAEARLRSQLGFAYAKLRRYEDAAAESQIVLQLAMAENDAMAQASALSALGRAARGKGDLSSALDYLCQSRDLQHRLQQWRGVALCRRRIGDVLGRLGHYDEAIAELRAAAATMEELGDPTQHARTLTFLGTTHLRAGRTELASAPLQQALSLMQSLGSPYYQAEILTRLGEVAEKDGDRESTRKYYDAASSLYAAVEDPKAKVLRARLEAL